MIENSEPPQAPHTRGGPRWLDIVQTITLVFVSCASLYVSANSGGAMERLVQQNERLVRATSTPFLQFVHGNAANPEGGTPIQQITFSVENVGTGPARIEWFEVRYKGAPMASFQALLGAVDPTAVEASDILTTTSGVAPTMMPAGEERIIALWNRPPATDAAGRALWSKLDSARWELEIETCYCTVFDECFTTNAQADIPKSIPACKPEGRVNFDG